jgi:16S rRNA (adenine1518-N6/adenine1519-N6)-dimethyltransferase
MQVKAKKSYGQHFLTDKNLAMKIASTLQDFPDAYSRVLELGPGEGGLTRFLVEKYPDLTLIEVDERFIEPLKMQFETFYPRIIHDDFLHCDLRKYFDTPFALIGNFPYNISSQILFKVLEYKEMIPEMTGMFQKEVAERLVAFPSTKEYGLITVLMQAFYHTELLFTVNPRVFVPKPKVFSAVVRLKRKEKFCLEYNEKHFFRLVKTAFGQRRKILSNSLKEYQNYFYKLEPGLLLRRPEELNVFEFIDMAEKLQSQKGV